jgi:hypothetical protein
VLSYVPNTKRHTSSPWPHKATTTTDLVTLHRPKSQYPPLHPIRISIILPSQPSPSSLVHMGHHGIHLLGDLLGNWAAEVYFYLFPPSQRPTSNSISTFLKILYRLGYFLFAEFIKIFRRDRRIEQADHFLGIFLGCHRDTIRGDCWRAFSIWLRDNFWRLNLWTNHGR